VDERKNRFLVLEEEEERSEGRKLMDRYRFITCWVRGPLAPGCGFVSLLC